MDHLIKAVIIENNDSAYKNLHSLLIENSVDIEVVGRSKTVVDGIQLIKTNKPHIIFLDIELDDGNGFEILDQLENQNFEVVFVTAFDSYLEKAIQHFAFNYILKPISQNDLEKVIRRYKEVRDRFFSESKYQYFKEFISEKNAQILLQDGSEYISVFLDHIIHCEASGNYTLFHFNSSKPILASYVLKHYDELLSHRGFFRANRSSLINTSHIRSIYKKETIILSNGTNIHVSLKYREGLLTLIQALT